MEFSLEGFDLFTPSILLLVDELAVLEADILSRQTDIATQVNIEVKIKIEVEVEIELEVLCCDTMYWDVI